MVLSEQEFKRPKEAKKKGRRAQDKAEPPIKKISLREVLTDPVLVALETKTKDLEEAKRQESQMLGDKMTQRMRNSDARRQRMRERAQAAMVRVQRDQAERLADVHAANSRALQPPAPGQPAATAGGAQPATSASGAVATPSQNGAAHPAAGGPASAVVGAGPVTGAAAGAAQAPAQAANGAPVVAAGVPQAQAVSGAPAAAAAYPNAANPYSVAQGQAYTGMMHAGMQTGYPSSFASMMGMPGTDFPFLSPLPPATMALFNEEERKREGERMARSAEEQRKEAELRAQESREENEEARQIREHEQRVKELREEERKTREEFLETKRRMRQHKRQLEQDAKQAKRDNAQARRDEAEALRLAKEQKKQMREMLQSGRLSVLDRDAGARQVLGESQIGAVPELPELSKPPNAFAIFRTRVTETVKAELAARQAEAGAGEVNFSTEIAQRWNALAAEEKDVYMQEASKLMAEYQQALDRRVAEEHERRQQMHSLSLGAKRSRTQTDFLALGDAGLAGAAGGVRLDDAILKRARTLQQQKRRLTRSWKAMVLQAVLALAPDYSTAAPLEEVIRKIGQLHPAFATKAEGKTKMLLDDLTKDAYVHVWCPSDVIELEEEDVELQDPDEHVPAGRGPVMAKLAGAEGGTYWGAWEDGEGGQRASLGDASGGAGEDAAMDEADEDAQAGEGGEGGGYGGFKSTKKRRSEWEKKAHYYAPADALELLPEGDDIGPVRNREYPTESEDRAAHNAEMRAQTASCDGRKAEFVLKHWDKFAPFISPEHRAPNSPLALKLHKAADQMRALESAKKSTKTRIPVHRQPACIVNGEMHPYQLEGLKWMVAQHDKGAGGILGDEMGLGKTLQVISLLGFMCMMM